ncbi:phage major capsid protein [Enterococcus sp. AZ102]|uniref:phage major capsid protein n=1 Tax=Enterococcus sp. AZ102 TaxID=2774865 RepID=UPI003F1E8AC4
MNIEELKAQAQEALDNGDLAKVKELLAQIKAQKDAENEKQELATELDELTKTEESEEKTDETEKDDVSEDDSETISDDEVVQEPELDIVDGQNEEQEKEEKRSIGHEGEERDMKEIQETIVNKLEDFEGFIRSEGTEKRSLDTTSGAVVVPVEVSTDVLELKDDLVDLSAYVTKEMVGTGQGKFPVAKRAQAILATKAELAEIAEINDPLFLDVEYKAETRIGQIAFSNELLEDAAIDVVAYAKKQMQRMVKNTNNKNILDVLNGFAKTNATTADDLKRVINVELDPELDLKIVLNQDAYQVIDTMKDADGRYLLQDSIASASGKMLFGKEVILVSNKVAPTPKNSIGYIFVGDLAESVFMAQRSEITAEWEKFDRYSKGLAVGVRSDYKAIDAEAGKLVNFTAPAAK